MKPMMAISANGTLSSPREAPTARSRVLTRAPRSPEISVCTRSSSTPTSTSCRARDSPGSSRVDTRSTVGTTVRRTSDRIGSRARSSSARIRGPAVRPLNPVATPGSPNHERSIASAGSQVAATTRLVFLAPVPVTPIVSPGDRPSFSAALAWMATGNGSPGAVAVKVGQVPSTRLALRVSAGLAPADTRERVPATFTVKSVVRTVRCTSTVPGANDLMISPVASASWSAPARVLSWTAVDASGAASNSSRTADVWAESTYPTIVVSAKAIRAMMAKIAVSNRDRARERLTASSPNPTARASDFPAHPIAP